MTDHEVIIIVFQFNFVQLVCASTDVCCMAGIVTRGNSISTQASIKPYYR